MQIKPYRAHKTQNEQHEAQYLVVCNFRRLVRFLGDRDPAHAWNVLRPPHVGGLFHVACWHLGPDVAQRVTDVTKKRNAARPR
jgi:hypothetical protein